jgi:hypothetical protein
LNVSPKRSFAYGLAIMLFQLAVDRFKQRRDVILTMHIPETAVQHLITNQDLSIYWHGNVLSVVTKLQKKNVLKITFCRLCQKEIRHTLKGHTKSNR